jgi:hypothetical protein
MRYCGYLKLSNRLSSAILESYEVQGRIVALNQCTVSTIGENSHFYLIVFVGESLTEKEFYRTYKVRLPN